MSELGVGDERFELANFDNTMLPEEEKVMIGENEKPFRKQKAQNSMDITKSLPIVVIKNYSANFGALGKEVLLQALAQWAATLVENQVSKMSKLIAFFSYKVNRLPTSLY